jgi:hypothetical protein
MADRKLEQRQRHNPDLVVFRVGDSAPAPGAFQEHAGIVSHYVQEPIENLRKDWSKIAAQVEQMLEPIAQTQGAFAIDEVEFSLGFSVEGGLYFVAKAGLDAGIKVTWKRKPLVSDK